MTGQNTSASVHPAISQRRAVPPTAAAEGPQKKHGGPREESPRQC